MKKFSKSEHQAVTELNVVPLLDLAFVLLVIFIITTAPVVNDLELNLPKAAQRPKEPQSKINYVAVDPAGRVFLNRQELTADELLAQLIEMRTVDPDLNIVLRGDSKAPYRHVVAILDKLQQANIGKVNLATDPLEKGL